MTKSEQEHFDKYENLYRQNEWVKKFIPFTKEEVKNALASGDNHLNSLPLKKWDMTAIQALKIKGLSLSEKVCLLKHTAKYHYEKD